MQWFDTEGDAKKLLNYLQNQVTGNMSNYQYGEEEIEILKQEWTQALIWHLRSLIPGSSLTQTTTEEI
jgi:hypothetical protein